MLPQVLKLKQETNIELPIHIEEYGIFYSELISGEKLVLISARDFCEYMLQLQGIGESDSPTIIMSPEFITAKDIEFTEIPNRQDLIAERICQITEISSQNPSRTLIVGSPFWDAQGSLRNSAVIINNGQIISVTDKMSNADAEESSIFDFSPSIQPQVESHQQIIICSDLAMDSLRGRDLDQATVRVIAHGDPNYWLYKYTSVPQIIKDTTTTLFVPMNWGVGAQFIPKGFSNQGYYRKALFNYVTKAFESHPNLMEIIVCDATLSEDALGSALSEKPFNIHFRRG